MILLTGATGFLGRHLLPRLAAEGRAVRALSRSPREGGGATWITGDLAQAATLAAAVEGIDTVIHAGAALQPGEGLESVNAGGTRALARAAREAGVGRFIHVSSAGVYGDGRGPEPHREDDAPRPSTPYERSKLAAEEALREELAGSPVAWTLLRPAGLYGADRAATAALFGEVARRRFWLHGATRVVVHPTHVDDLVEATLRALARAGPGGEIFNVGGERALEYSQLIAEIGRRVGRGPLQLRLPALRLVNRGLDTTRARAVLGLEPIPLAAGLDRTAAELGYSPPHLRP